MKMSEKVEILKQIYHFKEYKYIAIRRKFFTEKLFTE